jgi:hypothetical protein
MEASQLQPLLEPILLTAQSILNDVAKDEGMYSPENKETLEV